MEPKRIPTAEEVEDIKKSLEFQAAILLSCYSRKVSWTLSVLYVLILNKKNPLGSFTVRVTGIIQYILTISKS